MPSQEIKVKVENDAGSDISRSDKETRKQIKKQTEYAKEAEKVRDKSVAQSAGINFSVGAIVKQSQVFTSTIGSIFQLLGALVDVILAPFLPIVVPAIRALGEYIPKVAQWAKQAAEIAIPAIKTYIAPLVQGLQKIGSLQEGGFKQIGDWLVQLATDITTKLGPKILEFSLMAAEWSWNQIVKIYNYLKEEIPAIKALDTQIRDYWRQLSQWWNDSAVGKWFRELTWEGITTYFTSKWQEMHTWATDAATKFSLFNVDFQTLKNAAIISFDWLQTNLPKVWENLGIAVEELGKYVEKVWVFHAVPYLKAIEGNAKLIYGFLGAYMPRIIEGLKEYITSISENLNTLIDAFSYDLSNALFHLPTNIKNAIKNGLEEIINPISGSAGRPTTTGMGFASTRHLLVHDQMGTKGLDKMSEGVAGLSAGASYMFGAEAFRDKTDKAPEVPNFIAIILNGVEGGGQYISKIQNMHAQDMQKHYNNNLMGGGANFGAFDVYGEDSSYGWMDQSKFLT